MKATKPLTIVIVGGVAGGASAATRARRMNEHAQIILLEKDDYVSFANCGLPYHIGGEIADREDLLVATPEFLKQRFRLDVRIREEVVFIERAAKQVEVRRQNGEIYRIDYDKLILAPGARPFVPPIENVAAENVMTLRNMADTDRIKRVIDHTGTKQAVVVGAGYIGLEMVEQLMRRGIKTSLVELQPQVLPLLDAEMAEPIRVELENQGVGLHLGTSVQKFGLTADRATSAVLSNGQALEADLFILGIGVRPHTQLAEAAGLSIGASGGIATNEFMQTSDPDIYGVGDACEYEFGPTADKQIIALAGPANRAGRLAGEHAATGGSATMSPVMGTSAVRVFDVNVATTGLSMGLAERKKRNATSVTIVAKHHAGYYPGAQQMTLKLVYDPGDGRILGAQAVGGSGVDKRIDIIATAMSFGGTVHQLAGLDLAYAPPFGAAKDPVHMAAFAACNQLDGIEFFVHCDADLSGHQVIDVRTTAEVQQSPLRGVDGWIHIPVDELRDRIDELNARVPTVVCCGVGVRGHLAARILKQHGFDVSNLSGGALLRNRCF
jgi:NADPH-dependent 2,4-dienoyl-CoA reductase/sulfur reductase-like enzyme/rhodanese-related sulfurtransferase